MGISLRDAIRRPASAAPGTEHCALRRRGSHDYARRSASLYRRPHWEAAVAGPEWGSSSWFPAHGRRSEEHTSELQSLMRISYAVFCLKTKKYQLIIQLNNLDLYSINTLDNPQTSVNY